jgi:Fe-S cluster biogenesis protein NfuA
MRVLKRNIADRKAAIEARIREALDGLRPLVGIDPCGLDLLEFDLETGRTVLHVEGDCPDCQMSAAMLMQGIAVHLRTRVPEVREVRAADGTRIDPDD